jgi:hypothetical protein
MTKRNLEKRQNQHDEFFTELREKLRQHQWEKTRGDYLRDKLSDIGFPNYRYGSDAFTMFKHYIEATRNKI